MEGKKIFSLNQPRTKNEILVHPKKPPQSVIEDIRENPFHLYLQNKTEISKPTRGLPIKDSNKDDFKKYIFQKKYFSELEILEVEKITGF